MSRSSRRSFGDQSEQSPMAAVANVKGALALVGFPLLVVGMAFGRSAVALLFPFALVAIAAITYVAVKRRYWPTIAAGTEKPVVVIAVAISVGAVLGTFAILVW